MKKLILENQNSFILYLCIVISVFMISSYYYFLDNYMKIEDTTNKKYIQYIINKIDEQHVLFNKDGNHTKKIAGSYEYLLKDPSIINFFDTINYYQNTPRNQNITDKMTSKYLGDVIIKTNKNHLLENNIEFFDENNKYLFSIITQNQRELINTGQKTIMVFLLMVVLFITIMILLTRKYYNAISNNNEKLEKEVEKRTSQIQSTLIELEKANLKLYDMAHTDFLTKIRNRRNFFIHAENFFTNAIRKNKDFSVIMIDIDNFKPFNDIYGHNVGDRVLIEFTKCIQEQLDEKDIFGRLGGEEFAIALYDMTLYEALEKAEMLRNAIEKIQINTHDNVLKMTASFGVSDIRGCKDLDQVIHKADSMLYSAKHSGKNRVRSRLSTFN